MPRTKTTATRTRRTRTAKVPTMATGIGASLKSLLADHNRQIKQLTRERDRAMKALEAIGKDLEKIVAKAPASNGTPKEPRQRKPRGKITDPAMLEKRRASLAKARKARAAKRKAAKQAATATA